MSRVEFVAEAAGNVARSAFIVAVVSFGVAIPAFALECPAPQKLAGPGVLKETPAQTEKTAQTLSSGAPVDTELQAIISDLRSRYPNIQNGEIANYLITAYCPVAAAMPGASEGEKKVRLDNFVSLLMGLLY
jgi:hypothetical protein